MAYVNMKAEHPWWLTFICCGREDGVQSFSTWEEADAFRESYCDPGTGHDRAAVITRSPRPQHEN